jgi:hypothetical protein
MTVLGVKAPEGGSPPPWLGTRFGDPSKFQRRDIAGGFHCGWDVWENTGAPVLAPLPGIVIESRDLNTVSEDFNMSIQLELRLPRAAKNGVRVVYMQVLHAQAHSMLPLEKRVEAGERVCRVGFFGMQRIGNPHAHIEFFWSKAAALAYEHAFAVDPFWIRRNFFPERTRLLRVPPGMRWWRDRERRPTDGKVIMPAEAEVASPGIVAEGAAPLDESEESYVPPQGACGSGEVSEETLRSNGLPAPIDIREALGAEGYNPDTPHYQADEESNLSQED